MFASHVVISVLLHSIILGLGEGKIDIKKEAFRITQESCKTLSDQNSAAPILFAAADLIAVGKTGAIGKSYGPGNTKYSISMMPHCIVKGDTDKKELTIRNLGPGGCGAVDVEANDKTPYLFFLRATSDPKIYDILNLGAKKLDVPGMLWSPVFNYFCTVKNKKLCTGSECASQCTYDTYPEGSCIQFEQNVIDAYNSLEAKKPKTTAATAAPETKATATKKPMKTTKKDDGDTKKMDDDSTATPYVSNNNTDSNSTKVAQPVKDDGDNKSCLTFSSNFMLVVIACTIARMSCLY